MAANSRFGISSEERAVLGLDNALLPAGRRRVAVRVGTALGHPRQRPQQSAVIGGSSARLLAQRVRPPGRVVVVPEQIRLRANQSGVVSKGALLIPGQQRDAALRVGLALVQLQQRTSALPDRPATGARATH